MLKDLIDGFVGGLFKLVTVTIGEAMLNGVADRHERYRQRRLTRQEEVSNEKSSKEGPESRDRGKTAAEPSEHQLYTPEFYEPPGPEQTQDYAFKSESFREEPVDSDMFPKMPSHDED